MKNLRDILQFIIDTLQSLVPIIIGLGLLLFLWGLVGYIKGGADEGKRSEGRNMMIYGTLILFVMTSVWGLVNLLLSIFFPGGWTEMLPIK